MGSSSLQEMSIFAAVAGLLSVVGAQGPTVPVHHTRPSRLIPLLAQLVPNQKLLEADDEQGLIRVKGSQQLADEVSSYVALFDIKPATLAVLAKVESEVDHSVQALQATCSSNSTFEWSDPDSGIVLAVTPRLNSDGTVTVAVSGTYQRVKTSWIVRGKLGEPIYVQWAKDSSAKVVPSAENRTRWPLLTLRLSDPGAVKRQDPIPD